MTPKEIVNEAAKASDWMDDLWGREIKTAKIGSTIRIRLPNNVILKDNNSMQIILSDHDKLEREQRMECLRLAQSHGDSNEAIVKRAKAFYKFIRKGK